MYIVFEGIVGVGKTTQAKKLQKYLQKKYPKKQVILTKEPGGSEIADDIRHIVQAKNYLSEQMDPLCEAYLYASSRAQTLHSIVKPQINKGNIVISDRSFFTSLSFQGKARGLGLKRILKINKEAVKDVYPDIVIYLHLPIKEATKRTFDHNDDKFETMGKEFFIKAKDGYSEAFKIKGLTKSVIKINATGSVNDVYKKILSALQKNTVFKKYHKAN